eukprot:TRINITY_DN9774_c0_g4_i1.p1 TRINITY_DN9774_c0_g4~~TRINITY_DN9774_c0_g4_i1.p1  ORF type:complete len:164 (-),score=36.91 TRINITY_DN9774_c0_g4_i1:303-794(-)
MAMPSTFMIQNLPSRWLTEEISSIIDESGFQGAYDFFYMPRRSSCKKSQSYGYAFINFSSPSKAQAFIAAAQNGALLFKRRLAKVVPAEIQGIEALERHFNGKNVMKFAVAPVFALNRKIQLPVSSHPGAQNVPASEAAPPLAPVLKRPSSLRWCDMEDNFDD